MRRCPLRSDVNRMCLPSWDIQGLSSVEAVLSSVIGASDSNGELSSGRAACKEIRRSALRESSRGEDQATSTGEQRRIGVLPCGVERRDLGGALPRRGRVGARRGEEVRRRRRPPLGTEREVKLGSIQRRRFVERRRSEGVHERRRSPGRVARAALRQVDPFGTSTLAREVHDETIHRYLGILVVLRARELGDERARPPGITGDGPATDPDVVLTSGRRGEVELELLECQRRVLHVVRVAAKSRHQLRRSERRPRPRVALCPRCVARVAARTARAAACAVRAAARTASIPAGTGGPGGRQDPLGAARHRGCQHDGEQRGSGCAQDR